MLFALVLWKFFHIQLHSLTHSHLPAPPKKNINKGKETSDCPSNSRGLHVLGNHLPFLLFFVIVDQYTQHEIYYFSPFKYPVELNTVPTPGRTTVCFPFTS